MQMGVQCPCEMKSTKKLFELEDKVALVTGSSKGIGLAIATALAEYGAKVVVSSRSQEAVNEIVTEFKTKGYTAMAQACHVGDSEQRKKLVQKTIETFGGIDILVNNAAINPVFEGLESMSEAVYDKMMNVNLKAAFDLSNLCFSALKKSKSGSIINIASVEGLKPSFGLGVYGITKAALIMLTQVQAKEWGKYGIRSNAICPGLIQTKFSAALWKNEGLMQQVVKDLPAGRMAQPQELTGLAVYLASNAGSYSTGGIYTVDGGHMIV
jgi:NAD(P)-dependent dehydrogenase (short-subunit alcohol dehydrogenase family)